MWRNHSLCQNRCPGSQNDPLGSMSWALRLSGWRWAHWDRPTSCRPGPGLQPLCKGIAQTQSILEGPHCELGTVLKVMENTVPPYLGREVHHTMMPTAAKRPYGKKKVGRVSPKLQLANSLLLDSSICPPPSHWAMSEHCWLPRGQELLAAFGRWRSWC